MERFPNKQYPNIAGCDEAGRGCLAGPVAAAAVILPGNMETDGINDSKKLSVNRRNDMAIYTNENGIAWAVGFADADELDKINILQASFLAMHRALDNLSVVPGLVLVDGNRFKPWGSKPYQCIVGGDAMYAEIAAASILAKTARDEVMEEASIKYPGYHWENNKGYATAGHIEAIGKLGFTPLHRKSFHLKNQLKLNLYPQNHG